jgi:hypothetical protein
MLKKFLANYGITLADLKNIFSDYSTLFDTYEDLKFKVEGGETEYAGQMAEIEQQIVNALRQSRNEFRIIEYVKEHPIEERKEEEKEEKPAKKKAKKEEVEEEVLVEEIPIEEEVVEEVTEAEPAKDQKAIVELHNANFGEAYNFLKVLSLLNASYKWKVGADPVYFFWDIDGESYIITEGNPLTNDDASANKIAIISPDANKTKAIQYLISAKTISVDSAKDTPSFQNIEDGVYDIKTAEDAVKSSFPEPVTKITYSKLDDAVKDLFKFDSLAKLLTLFAIKKISDENVKADAGEFKKIINYYVETPEPITIQDMDEKLVLDEEILKSLRKDGFLTDKFTLSDKGGIMMTLHKYCFNYNLHPFAFIYHEPSDIYNEASPMQYVTIEGNKTFYTNGTTIFERGGEHISKTMYDGATINEDLSNQLENSMKGNNMVVYEPYAYCLGLYYAKSKKEGETVGSIHASAEKLGVVVMHNFVNRTEFFVPSAILRYVMKNYGNDVVFMAQKDKPNLMFVAKKTEEGIAGEYLAIIATIKSGNALGISNYTFSLYDREGILDYLKNSNISMYFNGISSREFLSQNEDLWVGKTVKDVVEEVEQVIEKAEEPVEEMPIAEEEPIVIEKDKGAVELPQEEEQAIVVENGVPVEKEELDQYILVDTSLVDAIVGILAEKGVAYKTVAEGEAWQNTRIYVSQEDMLALDEARNLAEQKSKEEKPVASLEITSEEAEIEINNDIEILKKISMSSVPLKSKKVLEKIASYKKRGILGDDIADELSAKVVNVSSARGMKIKPSKEEPKKVVKPAVKVVRGELKKEVPVVKKVEKPVMKAEPAKKAKLPSVVLDTPKDFQQVWIETNKIVGKKRDVAIVEELLKRDVDAVMLEDLVAIGFNLEKWIISEVLIRVDNKYDIYKNNFLDRRYFISKAS